MLKLLGIKKDYRVADTVVHALKGVSITFRESEFVSILGPSGCGKTTLLNIIGGLDHYSDGELYIDNVSTKEYTDRDWDTYRNHRIGFIFQSYNLIPHQTILENVELALTISGIKKEERINRAKEALDKVGLKGLYNKKPNQLSGGQCQRVAIARALVNDPEILLADEPTGALDTVTSVQIMDLIKEIAQNTLVIMVTHNPELAEKYSTRIVRLLDGEIVSDSAPYMVDNLKSKKISDCPSNVKDIKIAVKNSPFGFNKKVKVKIATVEDGKVKEPQSNNKQSKKSKLSFWQAFRLSARNLISKFKRTLMVCFAGSIGIIGIATVLSVSNGVQTYIKDMQEDMLSSNPIVVAEEAIDVNALVDMSSTTQQMEAIKDSTNEGKINVNSVIEYLIKRSESMKSLVKTNEITKDYINFVKEMPSDIYAAQVYEYGVDIKNNIYTEAKFTNQDNTKNTSLTAIEEIYTALLKETDYKDYASLISGYTDSFQQLPNSEEFIMNQYDFVTENSRFATKDNELMLVIDDDGSLSDLFLAQFGYISQEQFFNIIYHAVEDERYDEDLYQNTMSFDIENIVNKKFTWYPNDTIFNEQKIEQLKPTNPFIYNPYLNKGLEGGIELEIVGILKAKEDIVYGSLQSGIYYTESFIEKVLDLSKDSQIVKTLNESYEGSISSMSYQGINTGITYTYNYYKDGNHVGVGFVGSTSMVTELMNSMMQTNMPSVYTLTVRELGGNDLPNMISIYPKDFETKDEVTAYLDKWNGEGSIEVNGKIIVKENRSEITYTDALELVISMINTMITMVTSALVAFTALSLVVSTVMIAIITYVSVMERVKEIGVIRSLGGRKKDVSRLFNAETFIIGSVSGIFGILITYGISAIINLIVGSLSGVYTIAALPPQAAVILIIISIALTLISGLIPASLAAKKDPVEALRSE